MKLDIDDGGLLYQDERFGAEYQRVMDALIEIFAEKVVLSDAGDMELKTGGSAFDTPEGTLWGRLGELYAELRLPPGKTPDDMVERWQAKLLEAAQAIKPAHDDYERASLAGMEEEYRGR